VRQHDSDQNTDLEAIARAYSIDPKGCMPCRNATIVAMCLQISSVVFAVLGLVIALSPWRPQDGESQRWYAVCIMSLVPILALWLISWGIHKRRLWAWFMALLVFGMYLLTGFAIGSVGIFGLAVLALLIFGVAGLISLFSRDCRKAFGVN
jgi:hypothetical protein